MSDQKHSWTAQGSSVYSKCACGLMRKSYPMSLDSVKLRTNNRQAFLYSRNGIDWSPDMGGPCTRKNK